MWAPTGLTFAFRRLRFRDGSPLTWAFAEAPQPGAPASREPVGHGYPRRPRLRAGLQGRQVWAPTPADFAPESALGHRSTRRGPSQPPPRRTRPWATLDSGCRLRPSRYPHYSLDWRLGVGAQPTSPCFFGNAVVPHSRMAQVDHSALFFKRVSVMTRAQD